MGMVAGQVTAPQNHAETRDDQGSAIFNMWFPRVCWALASIQQMGGGSWEDYARGLMDQPCYPKLSQMTPIQVHKEKGWEAEFLSGLPSLCYIFVGQSSTWPLRHSRVKASRKPEEWVLLLLLLLKMGKLRHKKVVALRLDPRLVSYLSEGDTDVITVLRYSLLT